MAHVIFLKDAVQSGFPSLNAAAHEPYFVSEIVDKCSISCVLHGRFHNGLIGVIRGGGACLIFLILSRTTGCIVGVKVVGGRINIALWELLLLMFVAADVFSPAWLVVAPLFYAYLEKELEATRLV